jgi:hypothetical protein
MEWVENAIVYQNILVENVLVEHRYKKKCK